ncbi:MAG: hypothetical protein ACI92G_000440 [Candidatus Pelagisphaera sp.]|jgi:hypothetical protein
MRAAFASLILFASLGFANDGDPPALPIGLGPETPSNSKPQSDAPSLPTGLGTIGDPSKTSDTSQSRNETSSSNIRLTGFLEARYGIRLQSDNFGETETLSELRLQTRLAGNQGPLNYRLTQDWILDGLAPTSSVDLNTGEGWIDLREAWVSGQPTSFLDIKAGRQITTWGTGDLLFISDLFPKDWRALILGRDEEYLKAPNDAIKASLYHPWINLDIVHTPEFDADRFITGERLSYFDPSLDSLTGDPNLILADYPHDSEWAARANRIFGNAEVALYYYRGYWKQPVGYDLSAGQPIFPRLETLSASWRQPLAGGLFNIEVGSYDSIDDPYGDLSNIRNSENRFLIGFEREIAKNLNGSIQYYVEQTSDYQASLSTAPLNGPISNRRRHVFTTRITQQLRMQTLQLSLFAFYSPSDEDGYLRPNIRYAIDDQWSASLGGNIFFGKTNRTFFGQLKNNTNAYFSVRRSY